MQRISKSRLAKYPRPLQGGVRVIRPAGKYQGLAGMYQQALDKANAANESRYKQIMGGYDDLRDRVMGDLEGVGAQERSDINRQYRGMAANAYQTMVNRGFANSTIPHTMRYGIERERSAAMGRLNDRLSQQRANYDSRLTEGKMGVMERRTDQGPDINQLMALSQALGRGGYGGGGGAYMLPPSINYGNYFNAARNQAMNFAMLPFMQRGYIPSRYAMGARERWLAKGRAANGISGGVISGYTPYKNGQVA